MDGDHSAILARQLTETAAHTVLGCVTVALSLHGSLFVLRRVHACLGSPINLEKASLVHVPPPVKQIC